MCLCMCVPELLCVFLFFFLLRQHRYFWLSKVAGLQGIKWTHSFSLFCIHYKHKYIDSGIPPPCLHFNYLNSHNPFSLLSCYLFLPHKPASLPPLPPCVYLLASQHPLHPLTLSLPVSLSGLCWTYILNINVSCAPSHNCHPGL